MRFNTLDDALHAFAAGPDAPGWDEALKHLLSDQTPDNIRQRLRQAMRQVLRAVSMEPAGYVGDDKPVCRIEDIAGWFGITEDEVRAHVCKLEAERGKRLLHDDCEVTLVQ